MNAFTMGIDTGGTFTDSFVADDAGRHWTVKVPTTPHDLTVCFADAIARCAETVGQDLSGFLRQTSVIRFSSTIGTNTILTQSGPKLGLLVTAGQESSLYGAAGDGRIFDFVPQDMVAGLPEGVDELGSVERAVDPEQVNAAVKDLLERGARILVISLANSVRNPDNERAALAAIDASYPRHYLGAVPTLLSSQVSGVADDAGRTAAAVINAYMHKQLALSLYRAEDDLRLRGFRHPLLVVTADGSVTRVAKTRALSTYQSGPAAGVQASALLARAYGIESAVTADVGGTSTDLGVIAGGKPVRRTSMDIRGLDVSQPSVDIHSIALGGGSICRVEDGGVTVGPDSAGAIPGPACFGLGGRNPTPTDAWLVLGYLDPTYYLGGRRELRPDAAARALEERIATPLGVGVQEAALAVARAAEEVAGEGIKRMMGQGTALVAYGGAGGILLPSVARRLSIGSTFLSSLAPVFSAFGVGTFDVRHRYEARAPSENGAGMIRAAEELVREARRDVRGEGFDQDEAAILVDFLDEGGEPVLEAAPAEALEGELPGRKVPRDRVAAVAVTAICEVSKPGLPSVERAGSSDPAPAVKATREVVLHDGTRTVPVYEGEKLRAGHRFTGPAIVESSGTTWLIPEGIACEIDRFGTAVLTEGA
jgi:N-methylhydantoinase A/acetophenone carboxylase